MNTRSLSLLAAVACLLLGHSSYQTSALEPGHDTDAAVAIASRLSSGEVQVELNECLMTIAIWYPIQCFPGVDVGIVEKVTTINLMEMANSVRLDTPATDPSKAAISLEPSGQTSEALLEVSRAEQTLVLSSQSLPSEERQRTISTSMNNLLRTYGMASKTVLRTCVGGTTTTTLPPQGVTIEVPLEFAADLQRNLQGYIKSFCDGESR